MRRNSDVIDRLEGLRDRCGAGVLKELIELLMDGGEERESVPSKGDPSSSDLESAARSDKADKDATKPHKKQS